MKRSEYIKQLRNELGMTQQEFAEHVGYTQDLISKIESGRWKISDEAFASMMARLDIECVSYVKHNSKKTLLTY